MNDQWIDDALAKATDRPLTPEQAIEAAEWVAWEEWNATHDWWHQKCSNPDDVRAFASDLADINQHEADLHQQRADRQAHQDSYRDPACGGEDRIHYATASQPHSAKPAEMPWPLQLAIILLFGFTVITYMLWIGG